MFKLQPFPHQLAELQKHGEDFNRFYSWEMGTGKTALCINNAAILWTKRYIDFVVVIAPNGVHRNWHTDEIPKHAADVLMDDMRYFCYQTAKAKNKSHKLELEKLLRHEGIGWLNISYDAVATTGGYTYVNRVLSERQVLLIVDESHYIKTPKAGITRKVRGLSRGAKFRRVMTGTPTDGNPFDIYSQMAACDPDFWPRHGLVTFAEFKTRYGVWKMEIKPRFRHLGPPRNKKEERERCYPVLVNHRNLEELKTRFNTLGNRLTKDILDLPPKLYTKRYVEMGREQRQAYEDMRNNAFLIINGDTCTTDIALATLMKLHQITSGFLKMDSGEIKTFDGTDDRLAQAYEIVAQAQHKVIIWASFVHNIDMLCNALKEFNPLRYDGSLGAEEKNRSKHLFQTSPDHKVFIANPLAGAEGLTLVQAKTTIYYSNNFRLIKRQQSEDRNHRIGQNNSVLYIDMVAQDSIDEKIVDALRRKYDIASQITGDELKEWI